jgi:hypothetical protein
MLGMLLAIRFLARQARGKLGFYEIKRAIFDLVMYGCYISADKTYAKELNSANEQ